MKAKVTPWEVEGSVDYEKLIREFGVKKITKKQREYLFNLAKKKGLSEHLFLKRELFYAQMDLDEVIKAHKEKKPIFLYTGRSPGGLMHIGHLISFMFTKYLQDLFDCNLYIQIPDDEKFLFKKDLEIKTINDMCEKDLNDIVVLGFNLEKTFIFKNSEYIAKMYTLYLQTAKKLTFSQARNTFGFENNSNIGQINYPALQIVPSFFEKGHCLIPCAIDQNPYFLLQRDIAPKLGYKKNSTILSKFLTSLEGPVGKMSASNSSKAILLTDDAQTIKKKINKYAFSGGGETLEKHRKYGGDTKVDVAYLWLYYLFEEDNKKMEKIKKDYESGEMLSGEIKKIVIDKIVKFLEKHNNDKKDTKKSHILEKYMYTGTLANQMWKKDFNYE